MKTEYKNITIPDFLIVIKALSEGGKCMSDLHRELNITYVHLHEIKHAFMKLDWVYIEQEKRRHNLFLTDKGKNIVIIATALFNEMYLSDEYILKKIEESKIKKNDDVDVEEIKKNIGL